MRISRQIAFMVFVFLTSLVGGLLSAKLFAEPAIAGKQNHEIVQARVFQVVNEKGEVLSELGYLEEGSPYLTLNKPGNKENILISLNNDGGKLAFFTKHDDPVLTIGTSIEQASFILLTDPNSDNIVNLTADKDARSNLEVSGKNGVFAGIKIHSSKGMATVTAGTQNNGNQLSYLAYSPELGPVLASMNELKNERVVIGNNPKLGPIIQLGSLNRIPNNKYDLFEYGVSIVARDGNSDILLNQGNVSGEISIMKNRGALGLSNLDTNTGILLSADKKGLGKIQWVAMGQAVKSIP